MIELQNINKIYKVGGENFYALRDACLTVNKGDMIAIQGASGSGKTTLLNILGCLGTVQCDAAPFAFKTPYRKCRDKALEALAKVGISDQAKKRANRLSGGQRFP